MFKISINLVIVMGDDFRQFGLFARGPARSKNC